MINPNFIKNIVLFYCYLSFVINWLSIFFNPLFNIYFDDFSKDFTSKIFINIILKYINSNLIITFGTYNNFK